VEIFVLDPINSDSIIDLNRKLRDNFIIINQDIINSANYSPIIIYQLEKIIR